MPIVCVGCPLKLYEACDEQLLSIVMEERRTCNWGTVTKWVVIPTICFILCITKDNSPHSRKKNCMYTLLVYYIHVSSATKILSAPIYNKTIITIIIHIRNMKQQHTHLFWSSLKRSQVRIIYNYAVELDKQGSTQLALWFQVPVSGQAIDIVSTTNEI